jgi:hypothetical protein
MYDIKLYSNREYFQTTIIENSKNERDKRICSINEIESFLDSYKSGSK